MEDNPHIKQQVTGESRYDIKRGIFQGDTLSPPLVISGDLTFNDPGEHNLWIPTFKRRDED